MREVAEAQARQRPHPPDVRTGWPVAGPPPAGERTPGHASGAIPTGSGKGGPSGIPESWGVGANGRGSPERDSSREPRGWPERRHAAPRPRTQGGRRPLPTPRTRSWAGPCPASSSRLQVGPPTDCPRGHVLLTQTRRESGPPARRWSAPPSGSPAQTAHEPAVSSTASDSSHDLNQRALRGWLESLPEAHYQQRTRAQAPVSPNPGASPAPRLAGDLRQVTSLAELCSHRGRERGT